MGEVRKRHLPSVFEKLPLVEAAARDRCGLAAMAWSRGDVSGDVRGNTGAWRIADVISLMFTIM